MFWLRNQKNNFLLHALIWGLHMSLKITKNTFHTCIMNKTHVIFFHHMEFVVDMVADIVIMLQKNMDPKLLKNYSSYVDEFWL